MHEYENDFLLVTKRKLQKFADIDTFSNVLQPKINEDEGNFLLSGKWNKDFFKNDHPLVLELGCGKGEYTLGLAKKYTDKNFIGIDIKGARIWRGSKIAIDESISNVAFLRIQIAFIEKFFGHNEVDEIWITFPDPQPKKPQKRLTSANFLEHYKKILKKGGIIHLKTDNTLLFNYTLNVIVEHHYELLFYTYNLYQSNVVDDILSIQTYYEYMFQQKNKPIHYLKFQ